MFDDLFLSFLTKFVQNTSLQSLYIYMYIQHINYHFMLQRFSILTFHTFTEVPFLKVSPHTIYSYILSHRSS